MAVATMVDTISHVSPRQSSAFKLVSLVVAAISITITSIQYYQTPSESHRQPYHGGSLFHSGLPSKIISDSSLPFDSSGRFQIDGALTNVALSYVDAVHIDTYEQAIMLDVSRAGHHFNDGRDLRLIVSNGGKFMEARPKRGRASILLKPLILSTLCLHQPLKASAPCSLTLTVMADSGNTLSDPIDFVLSGLVAPIIRHDRPKSLFISAGQLHQVAIQVQSPGADISADGLPSHPIYLSATSEFDLRNGGLGPLLSSKPDVPAAHYSLRIAKDFHIVLIRSDSDCLVTIEARSLPAAIPIVWNWTLFARTLLLAIFIFCLLTPTVVLFLTYRPGRSTSTETQTHFVSVDSSLSPENMEQKRLKNMTVLAAIPLKRFGDNVSMKNIQCSICLESYKADDLVRDLICAHRFHHECCDSWIIENGHCPLCLQDIGSAVNYHVELESDRKQCVLRRESVSA